jgi:DNA-binding HxlR family transcriptional regulator
MTTKQKKIPPVARALEDMIGCKWSLSVLAAVRGGVHRPVALEQAIPGISKKVLNERLRKLMRYGLVERRAFAEIPPRVEYRLTAFGRKFARIVDSVERLQRELGGERSESPSLLGSQKLTSAVDCLRAWHANCAGRAARRRDLRLLDSSK